MGIDTSTAPGRAGLGVAADGAPPRDDLFRAILPGVALRSSGEGGRPTMFGHFLVFNEWAEIDSAYEGHFLERVASGAAAKTIAENRRNMRVLFHHGRDSLGVQVLGSIDELREDDRGAYYEVGLFDGIPPLVMDGLRAGEYGASYRFTVMREDFVQRPARSDHNPRGLPERTIREVRIREFGPTPFPAFEGATSGVRSITDDFRLHGDEQEEPRGRAMVSLDGRNLADAVRSGLSEHRDEEERASRLYERSTEFVGSTAWAIHPPALATILGIIADRASGKRLTEDEIRERIGTRDDLGDAPTAPVAVLRLCGPIVPHATLFSSVSGAASVEDFQKQFRDAAASTDVQAILLDIHSPGGSSSLIAELASEIRAARGEKPVVAIANTFAASAAYWIASAADELVVTPSGMVGSIGVYTAHEDISKLEEMAGVKTTLVSAGKFKVEGNPFEPLSADAEAHMQEVVDEIYGMFLSAVAKGRDKSVADVRANFGEGRMVMPSKALEVGMVDRIATFDETLARLEKQAATQRSTADATPAVEGAETPTAHPADGGAGPVTSHPDPARRGPSTYSLNRKEEPSWRL